MLRVDEKRNPRTRAMVNQLMDRCLAVLDVEPTTAVCPPRLTGTDAWIGHGTTLRMLEPDGWHRRTIRRQPVTAHRFGAELPVVEPRVQAAAVQELGVGARSNDATRPARAIQRRQLPATVDHV